MPGSVLGIQLSGKTGFNATQALASGCKMGQDRSPEGHSLYRRAAERTGVPEAEGEASRILQRKGSQKTGLQMGQGQGGLISAAERM